MREADGNRVDREPGTGPVRPEPVEGRGQRPRGDWGPAGGVDGHERFWALAEPMLASGRAERGTMMGLPCLRTDGAFFASLEPRSGHLIVKLPADRVAQLIEGGAGAPFAPNGRRFREWVLIERFDEAEWASLLEEARGFVTGQPGGARKR
jgi:hypothetical protein